jgi:SulP family sulfate permease
MALCFVIHGRMVQKFIGWERMKLDLKFSPKTIGPDLGSGLTVALISIPEGMAYAMVAGVDPIYGLYTGMVTTIVAALTGSTSLMIVTLTNALALVTADALASLGPDVDPIRAMFTLTFLVGAIMFLLGILRLGSVIRFVSAEVMSGFVFATALLIVLGQYDELVGYASTLDANKLVKAIDITLHISEWDWPTVIVGIGSIIVLLLLKRIRAIKKFADVFIIILSSVFVILAGWATVELVGDIADVPRGLEALPTPVLPDFSAIPALMAAAVAAAVVGLAESSGAGASYPNPDESKSDMSQDFSAQGLGNLIGSFFQAMPAGGSLSRTGINAGGGALTHWSGVFAGLSLALVLVLFGNLTELIPMTGLAALLIVIGFEVMIKESRILREASRLDRAAAIVSVIVIVIAVLNDLTVAIFAGVFLSLLLFTFKAVSHITAVRIVLREDGRFEKTSVPEELPSNEVTALEILGTIYFATVYSFDDIVPDYRETKNAVLIIQMRERQAIDETTIEFVEKMVPKLHATGNQFMVCGITDAVLEQVKVTAAYDVIGAENFFLSRPIIGASLEEAWTAAEKWIAEQQELESTSEEESSESPH